MSKSERPTLKKCVKTNAVQHTLPISLYKEIQHGQKFRQQRLPLENKHERRLFVDIWKTHLNISSKPDVVLCNGRCDETRPRNDGDGNDYVILYYFQTHLGLKIIINVNYETKIFQFFQIYFKNLNFSKNYFFGIKLRAHYII